MPTSGIELRCMTRETSDEIRGPDETRLPPRDLWKTGLPHSKLCDTRRASLPPLDYLPCASQLLRLGGLILVCSAISSPPSSAESAETCNSTTPRLKNPPHNCDPPAPEQFRVPRSPERGRGLGRGVDPRRARAHGLPAPLFPLRITEAPRPRRGQVKITSSSAWPSSLPT